MRTFHYLLLFLFLSGCATLGVLEYDKHYGIAKVENRFQQNTQADIESANFKNEVKPILDNRCVVCHGCYDAPCQLKMENPVGIERGANKTLVYNGERLLTAKNSQSISTTTQLTPELISSFRHEGFFPVLNERQQSTQANTQASVFYQMLALKQKHPLPKDNILGDDFDFALDRNQQCPTIEEFAQYEKEFPLAGMPYGLPALTMQEHNTLTEWLAKGAIMPKGEAPTHAEQEMINQWETLLNGSSKKVQLVSRYLFEHLYLANLYFDEKRTSYFKLVRSSTPPGEQVSVIYTRRPFDSPFTKNQTQVFYRLVKNNDTIIAKRHMPYPFGNDKFKRLNELFYALDFTVNELPDYQLKSSSNPFVTFKEIPAKSRYKFLLEQSQFSIMNFIKGPVCRGQVALNVIDDHFWVAFHDPETIDAYHTDEFIVKNSELLQLPASTSDKTMSLIYWRQYAKNQEEYLQKKLEYLDKINLKQRDLDLDLLWKGNGNPNATLTVFRHFDSASVLQGFVGEAPKTAWLISYPLLERIHYLLVAGFDVYGNVGHQLKTRLYMDFLRMEAESAFIALLPAKDRKRIHEHWYRDTSDTVKDYIFSDDFKQLPETNISYKTDDPKTELFQLIKAHTQSSIADKYTISSIDNGIEKSLSKLNRMVGSSIAILPQVSYVMINTKQGSQVYSLINNSAHTNVAHLFAEDDRRRPEEDTLTVTRGIVGTYPNAFFELSVEQVDDFVMQLSQIQSEQDYRQIKDSYAIRRTSPNFWSFADKLHQWYLTQQPASAGLLDFNRLENR